MINYSKVNRKKAIKKSNRAKLELYDRLYDIGNFLLKKYNPCSIKRGTCNGPYATSFCCDGCKYKTSKGCSVKSLWCKLWLCGIKHPNKIREQFYTLSCIAYINGLSMPRESKGTVKIRLRKLHSN